MMQDKQDCTKGGREGGGEGGREKERDQCEK